MRGSMKGLSRVGGALCAVGLCWAQVYGESGQTLVRADAKEQDRKAISSNPARSTDGKLDGVLIHYPAPRLDQPEKFANPESMIEGLVMFGKVLPEWGIYEKTKDTEILVAIGYGVTADKTSAAVFRSGRFPPDLPAGMFPNALPKYFHFDSGGFYAVSGTESTSAGKRVVLSPLVGKVQTILGTTEVSVGAPLRIFTEVHRSAPSVVTAGAFPPIGVASLAARLMVSDGTLKPEWTLVARRDPEILLVGKRDALNTPIRYDNSRGDYPDFFEKGVYESDGKGAVRLKNE
jgi:hypothetical protein